MIYRLEKDFVSGSYTYDSQKEGLISIDRFQGTFLFGFLINTFKNIDILDNPYIEISINYSVTGSKSEKIEDVSLRNCTDEEGAKLYGKYWY